MKKHKKSAIILSVIILISLFFALNPMLGKNNKTMVAIYSIGSDLEDDSDSNDIPDEKEQGQNVNDGASSDDMREMIKGYKSLNANQKSNIKLLIGYGGARKKGWQGIKYTDINCLMKDAEDDYFGNSDCYSKVVPKTNMGALKNLKEFLQTVKEQSKDCGKVIVSFADHGYSFYGIGPDTNYDDDDNTLTLNEIRQAFLDTGLKPDMIGFDACLMGSMEVAKSLTGISQYMIASEETEPGHGWDYNMIFSYIGKNPEADVPTIGKYMVNSFITSPEHKDTEFKTLSVIDLTKFNNVVGSIDKLLASLGTVDKYYEPLLQAASKSEQYGKEGKGEPGLCIDLVHFIQKIKNDKKELAPQCDAAIAQIKSFVVASKQDGSRSNANGIAVYSPENLDIWTNGDYTTDVSFSPKWTSFLKEFMDNGSDDSESPKIKEENDDAYINPEDYWYVEPNFQEYGKFDPKKKNGRIFNITDNKGVDGAYLMKGKYLSDSKYMSLGMEDLLEIEDSKYFIPEWNGSVLKISSGKKSKELIIPAVFEEYLEDENRVYSSDIYFNDYTDAALYIELDPQNNVVDHWVVPYDEDDDGNITMSKDQYVIEKGDTIQFYNEVIDFEKDTDEFQLGPQIEFTSDPVFTKGRVGKDCFYFCMAEDLKGNIQESDAFDVE